MSEVKMHKPRGRKRKQSVEPTGTSEPGALSSLKPEEARKPLSTLTIKIPPDPNSKEPIPADVKRPGLRSTPRRIILRIRKDFLFHNQILKKTKKKNISAVKENMRSVLSEPAPSDAVLPEQPVKKKRGRKPGEKYRKRFLSEPVPVKNKPPSVRGRRGRPRGRTHSNIPVRPPFLFRDEETLFPATDVLKGPRQPLPWNFSDPEGFFFPHLEPFNPSPLPPSRILQSPAGSLHDAMRKPVFQIRQFLCGPEQQVTPKPNRPTVILLKDPKRDRRYSNQRPFHGYERAQEFPYAHMSHPMVNGVALDYRHEASHHNMSHKEGVPREMFFSNKYLSEQKGYSAMVQDPIFNASLIQPPNQSSVQSCDSASNQSSSSNKPFSYPDTLNRQLIVDSIRVLYELNTDLPLC